jgi:GTP-binding protein
MIESKGAAPTSKAVFPPRAVDPEQAEAGRRLFAREARFVAGAADPAALPPEGLPEIAFAGRSNVGKSTLINAVTGRRMLARTSNTPGRTRQINFFDLGARLMLVDLPGYGYADAPKSAIKAWTGLVRQYLRGRAALRRVCLLLDSRRNAEAMEVAQRVVTELAAHSAAMPEIVLTSAVERRGIAELHETLAAFAAAPA